MAATVTVWLQGGHGMAIDKKKKKKSSDTAYEQTIGVFLGTSISVHQEQEEHLYFIACRWLFSHPASHYPLTVTAGGPNGMNGFGRKSPLFPPLVTPCSALVAEMANCPHDKAEACLTACAREMF